MRMHRRAVHNAPFCPFPAVRHEELRVEIAAELALQSGQEVGEGGALRVLRSRLLRLVLLAHDQSVGPLVQRVKLNARLVMSPDDRRLRPRSHRPGAQGWEWP